MNQVKNIEVEVRSIFKLYAEGKFEQGLQRSLALQKAAPKLAISNYCVGHGYGALNQFRKAEGFLRNAVRIEPRNVDYLIRLGRVLLDTGRIGPAQDVLMKARALNPNLPIVPLTLAIFYSSIDRFDTAVKFFQEVIDGNFPQQFKNGAALSWARALIEVGRTDEAETTLRTMLRESVEVGQALSELSALTPFAEGDADFLRLEREISNPEMTDRDRAILYVAKSNTYAAAKNAEAELACLRKSKELRGASDVSSAFGAYVDAAISVFTPALLSEIRDFAGTSDFSPIHVVGLPRSGTTLTERILSSHSRVGGAGELQLISNFLNGLLEGRPLSEFSTQMHVLGGVNVRERVREIVETMRFLRPDKERIVDKMPHNFLRCGLIAALFPKGSIVHCFRHPADNFLSGFKANLLDSHSYFHRPEWFIPYHAHYVRLMDHWQNVIPGRIFASEYERLVTEPERSIRAMLAFCGLEWEENCLYPEREGSRIATASLLQARNPINPKSVGGWKKFASFLQPIADQSSVASFK